ncbi:phosphotransferase family protein [Phytohabitans houttuyneae]|uniref:Aminoglycoside phosphotransferase n=1 Tax=Phytohabitans houttuyneae TaxID=1076126 RepID=A0A6V8JTL8_9ACTN|nr:phosphotransferase [Phytohabitans houttuyneae]GFJ75853.1 aminoglycoside phosphotransferase [Phytohabitans houttuyneae]
MVDSEERVRALVAAHLPEYRVESVTRLGAGLDNVAYEVNGDLIVRFGSGAGADREARLLTAVGNFSPLPVPVPCFTDSGCLAYPKLRGVPLLDAAGVDGLAVAAALGGFLAALHAAPVERMGKLVATDDLPMDEWRREARETYASVSANVPSAYRRRVETFLETSPPEDPETLAFSHNDLGIEHVLVDPLTGAVTGVIDWSDAAIVDPAFDFGLVYRDLGPAALDAALAAYGGGSEALRARAVFYARCNVFEDLAYGLETSRERYVAKSLVALEWLFA